MGSKSDSAVVAHARHELELAGAFDKTDVYDGFVGRSVLGLIKLFDHWCEGDGRKMEVVRNYFHAVASGGLLSPVTDNPDEWEQIEREGKTIWRNKRNPFYLSADAGKHWSNMQLGEQGISKNHKEKNDVEQKISEVTDSSTRDEQPAVITEMGGEQTAPAPNSTTASGKGSKLNRPVASQRKKNSSSEKSDQAEPKTGKAS